MRSRPSTIFEELSSSIFGPNYRSEYRNENSRILCEDGENLLRRWRVLLCFYTDLYIHTDVYPTSNLKPNYISVWHVRLDAIEFATRRESGVKEIIIISINAKTLQAARRIQGGRKRR